MERLNNVLNTHDQSLGNIGAALTFLAPSWLEEFPWSPPAWKPTGNLPWEVGGPPDGLKAGGWGVRNDEFS